MHNPMEQFEIKRLLHLNLFGIDASFTNSSTWMIIAVILATAVFVWGMRQRALVPGRVQSIAEMLYEFVADMVDTNAGTAPRRTSRSCSRCSSSSCSPTCSAWCRGASR